MEFLSNVIGQGLTLFSSLFVVFVGVLVLMVLVLFVKDLFQTKDAIRHNYPVIGRFRDLFSTLGEFFRQYFFAMDREEMPFNRAEREWVGKSSLGADNTVRLAQQRILARPEHRCLLTALFLPWMSKPRQHHRYVSALIAVPPIMHVRSSIFRV